MQELKRVIAREQPVINAALERHIEELPPAARPVARHVLAAGGKRLRPLLTVLTGRALGCQDQGLYTLGAAIEMLHAATLLHDDILDNSLLRRGKPAAHTVFATTPVVLAGDALLAKAMLMVSAFGDSRLTDCISMAVMRTAEGEIAEFDLLRNLKVGHEEYLSVITGKTAWMLRASCELGALLSGAGPALVEAAAVFGLELGVAFQMVDDALDFSPPAETGKPRGGDVKEGKVTPPLLLYVASLVPDQAEAFMRKFSESAFSEDEVETLCEEVFSAGHARGTRELAERHLAVAAGVLQRFPESGEKVVLEQMLHYIQCRDR